MGNLPTFSFHFTKLSAYIVPYLCNLNHKCQQISTMFDKQQLNKFGGLVLDEMEYIKSFGCVIGLILGEIKENEVEDFIKNNQNIENLLGKSVMQIFFMSTDGSISLPFWYFLSNKTTGHLYLIIFNLYYII